VGQRRRSREYALQVLYQLDQTGASVAEVLEQFWSTRAAPPEVRAFCERLVRGVGAHRAELDARIAGAASNWRVERMALVDVNVLRLAVYELLHETETPPAVAIDEAVEVAKKFGSEQSARFVNGVLDAVRRGAASSPQDVDAHG